MRVWYFICALFFLYNLKNLFEESDETKYKFSNETEPVDYLACFNLKEIFSNKKTIDLQQLDGNAYAYFYNFFFKRFNRFPEETKKNQMTNVNKSILNPIKSKNYFVLRDQFCVILEDRNIRIISKNPKYYILKKATYDLLKLNDRFENFTQTIVINKETSNCTKYYSKLKCLNQCCKGKNRLSKYIYNSNENGIVKIVFEYNSTIKKDEYECSNECKRNGCKLVHFEIKTKFSEPETKISEAIFLVPNFDYYTLIIGLICLIVNTSFYQLMPKLILFINLKTEKIKKRIKKLKIIKKVLMTTRSIKKVKIVKKLGILKIKIERYFNLTKTMILLIGLAYFLYYSTTEIKERNNRMKKLKEYESETYLVEPETLSLVVCVVIKKEFYRFKKLFNLEKATNRALNDSIKKIYLQFQNKKSKIDWKIKKNKVLFRRVDFDWSLKFLRCFQIEIYPREPKYQSLLATSKLRIEFKHDDYKLYLISEDENFNSKSYQVSEYDFIKKIEKRLKSNGNENCTDYKEAYSYCNSQQNCIDRCSSVKFVEKYKSASFYAVIDKKHFTVDQWNNSFINYSLNYSKIKEECEKEFQKKSCSKIVFESNLQVNKAENKIKEIDLHFDVFSKEEEEPSIYKLVTDILNMQSILLGQNAFKLLMMVYYLLKIKLKVKGSKYYLFLIYLICLSGFIYHTYFILYQLANKELLYFVYYNIETSIKMSEIIFCFDFDLSHGKINKNYKLTENYLDELSRKIKIESVFEKVEYLNNKSNEWISLETPNFTNSEFKIETFYFLDKKCFKIQQDMEYDRSLLNLLQIKDVLEIYFNRTFIRQENLNIYFFTKINNTMQFSRLTNLVFFESKIEYDSWKQMYSKKIHRFIYFMNQKSVDQKNNTFNLIKNPFLIFSSDSDQDDANCYFTNLMNDFEQNKKLRTLKLPLEKTNSSNEINDDLFAQYEPTENTDSSSMNSNTIKKFITNNFHREESRLADPDPDFRFELNFLKDIIVYTYRVNFTKITISLLNVLSFWFNFCILDLHVCVHYAYFKIVFIFVSTYKSLIRIETSLYKSILFNLFICKLECKFKGLTFRKIKPFP